MRPNSLPAGGPSREEIAQREAGHTAISPAVAAGLAGFFVLALTIVGGLEIAGGADGARTAWGRLRGLPSAVAEAVEPAPSSLWRRIVSRNRAVLAETSAIEDALEDDSRLGRTLRPPAQHVLSGWLGGGNERVYVGRDGWLFYAPDVEYLTGPPFLDERRMRRRVAAAREWERRPHPDPRPAILQFDRQLAQRGIRLILVPTPVKPAVHPERLGGGRRRRDVPLRNSSYEPLVAQLERAGITVFDPAPVLGAEHVDAQYLARDTHWRPEAMERVAERLAAVVRSALGITGPTAPRYRTDDREVVNVGDTAAMLDLARDQTLYPPERVWIRRVVEPDGSAWRSARGAAILVLGDSFSNIYSLASMGWGDSAGLIEQLSHFLNEPLDRIVQNDAGAYATREALAQAGAERLHNTRLVIWQFAARELAYGDWQLIELPR